MMIRPVFEPLWRCQYGQIDRYGQGLLAPDAWQQDIESFSVRHAGFEVTVKPKTGDILNGSTPLLKTTPGRLVWFREMGVEFNTHDRNTLSSPRCNFYVVGIETPKGHAGFKILESGVLEAL